MPVSNVSHAQGNSEFDLRVARCVREAKFDNYLAIILFNAIFQCGSRSLYGSRGEKHYRIQLWFVLGSGRMACGRSSAGCRARVVLRMTTVLRFVL